MLIEHQGKRPSIDPTAYVAPTLPPEPLVPIKWVAVGDPALLFPPHKHEEIDSILGKWTSRKRSTGRSASRALASTWI